MISLLLAASLLAGDWTVEALKEAPPAEVAAPIREALATEGVRILGKGGKPFVDLWPRKEIPAKKADNVQPASLKFPQLEEGTLLGVVRLHKKTVDFRDKPLPAGIFTLRYGWQPVDGNHVGASETRDFGLLCVLTEDTKLAPVPTKKLVEWSAKVSGSNHPSVLYLLPRTEKRESFPALDHDAEKDWRILDFRIPSAGEKEKFHRFGLIVSGVAPQQ